MKHIRTTAFVLSLMLALTGMGGVAHAGDEPAEESDTPEAENAAEEAPAPQFAAVEAPAEPTLAQISVTWSEDPVEFIVSDAQRWNAEDLCWEPDPERNGEISIAEGSNVKTFTVTNESEEALTASVTFIPDESLPDALKNAYAGVSYDCDPIPAGQTVSGTATVNFDFTDARLTDDTLTGGTLGSFILCLTPDTG